MTVWGLRKRWQAVREEAQLPWLRVYDLRHTALTRMAEAGAPMPVMMSFAGHISPRMQQHYIAISMEAKRRWAARAWAEAVEEMPYAPGGIGPEWAQRKTPMRAQEQRWLTLRTPFPQ